MSRRKASGKHESDPKSAPAALPSKEDHSLAKASLVLRPTTLAAASLHDYNNSRFGDLKLSSLVQELGSQTNAVIAGDLQRGEAMLTAQAHTLDAIFNTLAQCAISSEYMPQLEKYLKLALRAQAQCRSTWEALSTIKHPPIAHVVGQANIAHGHQQVNNGAPRVSETKMAPNKLMEQNDGERLDTGTAGAAGGADSAVEAVGAVNGAKNH